MANNNPAHIVLKNVRLSYEHILQPYSIEGQDPKYSATLLIPKAPANNKALIDSAIIAATEAGKTRFGAAFPQTPRHTVHDGDGLKADGTPYGAECKGCWVLTVSNRRKPGVVDNNLQEILNPTEIYSGIYADVGITFYAYATQGNKGISASLDNVRKVNDGEPLGGGRVSVEDDFGAPQATSAPAAPAYQQPPVYIPQQQPVGYPPAVTPGAPEYPMPPAGNYAAN